MGGIGLDISLLTIEAVMFYYYLSSFSTPNIAVWDEKCCFYIMSYEVIPFLKSARLWQFA